jgi:hypothetical protein
MSVIMRVLSLLLFLALLLDSHVVSDRATSNCPHHRVMTREVTGKTANYSTFEASCLGGWDIYSAYQQNYWDNAGILFHLRLLDAITVSASPDTGGSLRP